MLSLPSEVLDGRFSLRRATEADIGPIVGLLAEDVLRASVDSDAPEARAPYVRAFHAVDADPSQLLIVATDEHDTVVATMQLTYIPGLSRAGATRLQIEAVRVKADQRSNGLGGAMIEWAVAEGRRRGAALVQLTSDQSRADAHRFYDRLGFVASHLGFKLDLTTAG